MYYIYALIDVRSNLPFYIGKGKLSNKRHLDHFNESIETTTNRHKFYKIQLLTSLGLEIPVKILKTDITNEEDAYLLETKFIQLYGRMNIDTNGILTNICLDNRPPNKAGISQTEEHVKKRVASYKKRLWKMEEKNSPKKPRKKLVSHCPERRMGFMERNIL